MKLSLTTTLAACGLAFAPIVFHCQAQENRDAMLVSAEWLVQHLDDPAVVLLHVGDKDDYTAEHIRGAHYVERNAMSHPGSHSADALVLELPEAKEFQAVLRSYGVNDDSRIVVYWGSEWVTPTARIVFTLDWAGLGNRTVLLDGGLGAWKAAGQSVTADVPSAERGDVTVHPRPELIVEADWVQMNADADGYALVDGRARAFFDGVREDRGKAGHIPGASSLPWPELIDESLMLKDEQALRAVFDAAGVQSGDTVVAYCHIGQFATMVLFAARTLGHDVRLYDGAFQDWAARDLPVTTEPGGDGR
ncbi:MAG: rhodanese-like domain-containing protein [Gemmatimonadales bacterium]